MDFTCSADVFIENGHVELGGRVQGPFLRGYRVLLTRKGRWTLVFDLETLAEGTLQDFEPNRWHELKLGFRGERISASIDGQVVASITGTRRRGYVSLGSSYDENCFDSLKVVP
jgi:galactosylceramidase